MYSIADRQSFQTAVQLIKTIRENESTNDQTVLKRYVPIILVGNKSDLVRKRAVTKESMFISFLLLVQHLVLSLHLTPV